MTTAAWTSVLDQTSDAAFRTWVAEFIAKVLAVGLTQTSDTGQINTTTVTRAAINTDAGYAIFRFNDTQQATAPVFIKVMFGSGSGTAVPRIRLQVGTASNGTGTVSGTGSANTDIVTATVAASSVVTLYPSYMCYVDGAWWFSWKIGANNAFTGAAQSGVSLARSVDNSGVASADALATSYFPGSTPTARTISYLTSTIYTVSALADWATIGYGQTTTLVGGVPQCFKTYMFTPRYKPQMQMVYLLNAEGGIGVEFDDAVVGATSRHYIVSIPSTTTRNFALIWE